ncbi:MAG TPA: nuclear transport factor 2 family protein [Longimicrobiaceae bacterium]
MRLPLRSACVLLFALLAGACAAATSAPAPASATWSADEAQIRAKLAESAAAWNRADLKGHLAMYEDSVTFMTGNGPRPGVAPIEQAFTRSFFRDGKNKQSLRYEQVTVRPLGPGAALQNGRFVLSGGGEEEKSGWFTLIWVRRPDGWKAVHDHSS